MNKINLLLGCCLGLGFVLLFIGIHLGQVKGGILVIFPFLIGTGLFATLGMVLIIAALFLYIMHIFFRFQNFTDENIVQHEKSIQQKSTKIGGIIFIGPIPIIFGSHWKLTVSLLLIAVLIIIVSYLYLK
jgi:uncharacterized protein (TIGR00304 family)